MNDFIAYQYDENGCYVGETLCQRNPKTNKPMLPQYTTFVKPIDMKDGHDIWFDKNKEEWIYVKIEKQETKIDIQKYLENPSKENIKKAINILMELL
jgi:hypothetical protein